MLDSINPDKYKPIKRPGQSDPNPKHILAKLGKTNPTNTQEDELTEIMEKFLLKIISTQREQARQELADDILREFNKAGVDDLQDVRILTNSDSWHEFIKRATLPKKEEE